MDKEILVVGSGVAGSAIAREFARRGSLVRLLFRKADQGSSFTNQKWKHSGLLYPSKDIAKKAWRAYSNSHPLLEDYIISANNDAHFIALHEATIKKRKDLWSKWGVTRWGLYWKEMSPAELACFPKAIGGFSCPDCVVDFPALIHKLRHDVEDFGGRVEDGAEAIRLSIDSSNHVEGLVCTLDGCEQELSTRHVVLAMGAWSIELLRRTPQISTLPVIRKKCIVLSYPGKLVPGITVCLDVLKADGSLGDTTLVPYKGTTLAAGTDWVAIDDLSNMEPTEGEVNRLVSELSQWYPGIEDFQPIPHVCIKTERDTMDRAPDVTPKVYGWPDLGVKGLTVAYPGKASFMFDLAEAVVA